MTAPPPADGPWLLLVHQLPPKPDYLRVKVRRRLHRLGAVLLKNSVYLLPNREATLEDFRWLQREIVADGGEATVCAATFLDGLSNQEVEAMFRARADAEYREIVESGRAAGREPSAVEVERLARQLAEVEGRDFFGGTGANAARRVVADLQGEAGAGAGPSGSPGPPRGATWVTRRGVHVDRMASAWLIRRFIDERARFKFVAASGYLPQKGEVRFDMFEGEYTHVGDRCTFEVLVQAFVAGDPGLVAVGEIVHDIDCKDEKFGRPEAAGVARVVEGIVLAQPDDAVRLEAGAALFEGLYASLGRGDA